MICEECCADAGWTQGDLGRVADKTVRVWDLESGVCLKVLEGHTDDVNSVALTPDGRKAISGSMIIRSGWDLESGVCLKVLKGHTDICEECCADAGWTKGDLGQLR